jgi:anthranilate phosphoribosyltransferase
MAGSGKKGVKTPNISTRSHRALADLVAVNAATLIFLGTSQHTLPEALALAREVLASGAVLARLRDLARLSGGTDEAIRRWL